MIKLIFKKYVVSHLPNIATRHYHVEMPSECECEWDIRHRVIVRDFYTKNLNLTSFPGKEGKLSELFG